MNLEESRVPDLGLGFGLGFLGFQGVGVLGFRVVGFRF